MRLNGRAIHLPQLRLELEAAGIVVPALGTAGDELHTYTATGEIAELPPEARAVVDQHVPPPPPPAPDYGADVPEEYEQQFAAAVTNLRAYLATSSL